MTEHVPPSATRTSWTVVDAGVLAVALIDDGPDGDLVRQRLRGCRVAAPADVDLQVLAVWYQGHATGAIPGRRVDLAMTDLARMPLSRVPPIDLLTGCWDLLETANPAEAPYLALAAALDAPLLTCDTELARTASGVQVELLR
jgi:predicted nucleic acid-binding protein